PPISSLFPYTTLFRSVMGLNRFWRGINGLFKQTHSIFLKRAPLGSGLPCEFGLDFGSNIECNCHLCSHSSCTYFLLYLPLCCKSDRKSTRLNSSHLVI